MQKNADKIINLRKKIDNIDLKILILISKRFNLSKKISELKQTHSLPIHDQTREKNALEYRKKEAKKLNINEKFIETLFRKIFLESRIIQNSLKKAKPFDKKAKK